MSLIADVVHTEHSVGSKSALQREHVFLGVGDAVVHGIVGQASNGFELRKVDGVGMACARIQRSQSHREILAEVLAVRCRDKWRGEQRRSWTGIRGPVRCISGHHADGESFDRGIKHSKARSYAGVARTTEYFCEQAIAGSAWRISQADARCEVTISRRRQRARNSRICGIKNAWRRIWKHDRLLSRIKSGNLVVLLIPGLDAVPAQAIVQR